MIYIQVFINKSWLVWQRPFQWINSKRAPWTQLICVNLSSCVWGTCQNALAVALGCSQIFFLFFFSEVRPVPPICLFKRRGKSDSSSAKEPLLNREFYIRVHGVNRQNLFDQLAASFAATGSAFPQVWHPASVLQQDGNEMRCHWFVANRTPPQPSNDPPCIFHVNSVHTSGNTLLFHLFQIAWISKEQTPDLVLCCFFVIHCCFFPTLKSSFGRIQT